MGQVLGFSHCQEYGSVASTPDSTPPCTDGGNEESELYELQTARDWSEDEEVGYDDDDTLASSPSVWGTPRQNSLELTFSYIAIADAESAGGLRTHRERRRGGSRGSRTSLVRTDTPETPLDSPDGDWDPHGLTSRADEQEGAVDVRTTSPRRRRRQNETVTMQPSPQSVDVETQEGDTGIRSEESALTQMQPPIRPAPSPEPESPVVPAEPLQPTEPKSISPDAIAPDTQENPLNPCWDSALKPSDSATVWPHITVVGVGGAAGEIILVCLSWGLLSEQGLAKNSSGGSRGARRDREGGKAAKMANKVMDLIYWKDTERTGIILTALVVGLLCLFQLSIITVVSTVSLAVVCVTMSVRIYYNILHALKWGDGEHPFKSYLEMDISLSGEQAQLYMQKVIVMTLQAVDSLKRLFFVSCLFESLKLLVLLYLVTYLGDLCNGLTLLIIGVIGLFSLPLFYRRHQEKVDGFIGKIQAMVDNVKDFFRRLAHSGALPPNLPPGDDAKEKIQ